MTTENLLLKIEEKVSALLSEIGNLHAQIDQLKLENEELKSIEGNHAMKLQGLISLLDVFDAADSHANSELDTAANRDEVALLTL